MLRVILLSAGLLFTFSTQVHANVTAAVLGIETSGTELFNPGSPLTVKNEKLQLVCGSHDCEVTARYLVQSDVDVNADLEFITEMPPKGEGSVSIRHGNINDYFVMTPKRTFSAALKKGENTMEIKYRHRIARNLVSPAYFNHYSVDYISYDLWPLKGWKLAEDFTLDVDFYYIQDQIGILGWIFGTDYRHVSINAWDKSTGSGNIAVPRSTNLDVLSKGYEISYSYFMHWNKRFAKEFPDRLLIYFAPADEVSRFGNTGRWERP